MAKMAHSTIRNNKVLAKCTFVLNYEKTIRSKGGRKCGDKRI